MPDIYPDVRSFTQTHGFDFSAFDWTVQPFNTALCYLANDDFRRYYTDTAIRFMRCSPDADDVLTYMVFAVRAPAGDVRRTQRAFALPRYPIWKRCLPAHSKVTLHISGALSSRCGMNPHSTRTFAVAAPRVCGAIFRTRPCALPPRRRLPAILPTKTTKWLAPLRCEPFFHVS